MMGKLVLYLPDGATMDVPLQKERITIGRRADNDVCLPYPAVSGEHAQVTTILADSFLEDLGSTNGTLVNGRPITKHFLADHDQIDIGRQRLTYVSNNDIKVEPLPPDLTRQQVRGMGDRVEQARPLPQTDMSANAERRPKMPARGDPLVADLEREIETGPSLGVPRPAVRIQDVMPPKAPPPALVEPRATAPVVAAPVRPVPVPAPVAPSAPPPREEPPKPKPGPSVKVLSGASHGRMVAFPGPELTVGRVGVQVAIVRKVDAGYLLIPVEGKEPPRINGASVAPEGSPLHPGDTFEVAGVRLEISAGS